MSTHVKYTVWARISFYSDPLRDSHTECSYRWVAFQSHDSWIFSFFCNSVTGSLLPLHLSRRPSGGRHNREVFFSPWHCSMKCLWSPMLLGNNVALGAHSSYRLAALWGGKRSQVSMTWSDRDMEQTKWSQHSASDHVFRVAGPEHSVVHWGPPLRKVALESASPISFDIVWYIWINK